MSKRGSRVEAVEIRSAEDGGPTLCRTPLLRQPLRADEAVAWSGVFKALADPVRLRLLSLIASHAGGEVCVCELVESFALTAPTISHHLKVLREAGLVDSEKRANWVFYRARPGVLDRIAALFAVEVPR
jgi:ArsR family transcriptional regulator